MYHNVLVVAAGAVAHFATGWALYSNKAFGKLWKHDKARAKFCTPGKDVRINMAVQFGASLALSIATCAAIFIFSKSQSSITSDLVVKISNWMFNQKEAVEAVKNPFYTVLFIWGGFILPTAAGEVIWCDHNWKNWTMEMICELLGLLAIAATVNFLV